VARIHLHLVLPFTSKSKKNNGLVTEASRGRYVFETAVRCKWRTLLSLQAFQHGQTEVLKLSDVATRIRDLLRCEQPLVLLAHDAGTIRTLLEDLGIDTSDFSSGLSSLFK